MQRSWGRLLFVLGMVVAVAGHGVAAQPLSSADWRETLADRRDKAIEQVLVSARSEDPFLRANAIEAAQSIPQRALPLVQLALDDPNPVVRFAALMTVGQLKLHATIPMARRLLEDDSQSVRAAAIFALYRCDEPVDASPLAAMLASQDASVRGNAAMVLGMMGDASAAPMLLELARVPMRRVSLVRQAIVRIQVAEAVLKLTDDDKALSALRSGAYSQFDEVRILAVSMLGKLGDRAMLPAIAEMLKDRPIELQLAAAEALARLGRSTGLEVVLEATQSDLATVRSQAALTLGLFDDERIVAALDRLLADPAEPVRLAAAAAILRATAAPPAPAAVDARSHADHDGDRIDWIQP